MALAGGIVFVSRRSEPPRVVAMAARRDKGASTIGREVVVAVVLGAADGFVGLVNPWQLAMMPRTIGVMRFMADKISLPCRLLWRIDYYWASKECDNRGIILLMSTLEAILYNDYVHIVIIAPALCEATMLCELRDACVRDAKDFI